MLLTMIKEIWEVIQQTYSKIQDTAQIYEIKTKTTAPKQVNLSIIEYHNIMKELCLMLDYHLNSKMKCNEDAVM